MKRARKKNQSVKAPVIKKSPKVKKSKKGKKNKRAKIKTPSLMEGALDLIKVELLESICEFHIHKLANYIYRFQLLPSMT